MPNDTSDGTNSASARPASVAPAFLKRFDELSLEFRAAANKAARESAPVRKRVLKYLISLPEFGQIATLILAKAIAEDPTIPAESRDRALGRAWESGEISATGWSSLCDRLATDERFVTLLLESIEFEKTWGYFLGGDFLGLVDFLKSLREKIFGKEHPASRATASILLSLTSLAAIHQVAFQFVPELVRKDFTIPIRAELIPTGPLQLKLDTGGRPQDVPIVVKSENPLALKVEAGNVLEAILKQKGTTDVTLQQNDRPLSLSLKAAGPVPVELKSPPPVPLSFTSPAPVPLELSAECTVPGCVKGSTDELKDLRQGLTQTSNHVQALGIALSNVQVSVPLSVREKEKGTVRLAWTGNEHPATETCDLMVTVTKEKGTASKPYHLSFDFVPDNCSAMKGAAKPHMDLDKNVPGDFEPSTPLPFYVVIVDVNDHWWRKAEFLLRFYPNYRSRTDELGKLASIP